jgi:hypothetical protein
MVVAALAAALALLSWSGLAERRDHAPLRAAAIAFLGSLSLDHRAAAQFAFDDAGRLDWHYVPRDRKGLALGTMGETERIAAQALLRAGLSSQGYLKANGVMTLESVLQEEARAAGQDPAYRDPGRYFVSIYGDPRGESPFLVRFEGHHLALNFTSVPSEGTSPTPLFFGANPARVNRGPRAGFRLLAGEEDLARALARSLDAGQRKKAWLAETAPPELLFGPGKPADPSAFPGIAYADLTDAQQKLLRLVVNEFMSDLEPELARAEQLRLAHAGVDELRFAWAGGVEPGQGHYWRASGPTFVLEYDDTQDGANHVHALWRDPQNDFAANWLADHHAKDAKDAKNSNESRDAPAGAAK